MVTTRSKTYEDSEISKGTSAKSQARKQNGATREDPKKDGKTTSHIPEKVKSSSKPSNLSNSDVKRLIEEHGDTPLSFLNLKNPFKLEHETILAHILNAMLSAVPISHNIAAATLQTLVAAGYLNLDILNKSTWQQRTEVLTEGGYTHYREKTATALGELEQLIREKYDGDAANLVKKLDTKDPSSARQVVAGRIKGIKQMGNLSTEIFLETCQMVVPEIAPCVSSRNMKIAKDMGLGDENEMYKAVDKDNTLMARLCFALTNVRLES